MFVDLGVCEDQMVSTAQIPTPRKSAASVLSIIGDHDRDLPTEVSRQNVTQFNKFEMQSFCSECQNMR